MYGNPRYIVHFLDFLSIDEAHRLSIDEGYALAHKRAKSIGFYKYRGKNFGGGFVGSSYSIQEDARHIVAMIKGDERY